MIDIEHQQREIEARFDFERIHTVMKALDWKWGHAVNAVPSVEEIKTLAMRLLRDVITQYNKSHLCVSVGTGGFFATVEENGLIILEFIVEDARVLSCET